MVISEGKVEVFAVLRNHSCRHLFSYFILFQPLRTRTTGH
jgi:hypothetical protein